jgi:hypothetical protein
LAVDLFGGRLSSHRNNPDSQPQGEGRKMRSGGAQYDNGEHVTGAPAALFRAPNLRYRYRMERSLDRCCLRCDKGFRARRSSAKYCSNACRQLAYLDRHRPPGVGAPLTWADVEAMLWRPTPLDRD